MSAILLGIATLVVAVSVGWVSLYHIHPLPKGPPVGSCPGTGCQGLRARTSNRSDCAHYNEATTDQPDLVFDPDTMTHPGH